MPPDPPSRHTQLRVSHTTIILLPFYPPHPQFKILYETLIMPALYKIIIICIQKHNVRIIKVLWKLGHVVILNLIMVATSSVNESQAAESSSQVTTSFPTSLLSKL